MGELDAPTLSNNAAREAYGYQVQAQTDENNAKRVQKAGQRSLISSLLTGAIGGATSAYSQGLFSGIGASGYGAGTNAALSGNLNLLGPGQAYS